MAFPSRFEGFGLALAEGMVAGLPAVGFKNTPGVSELISDGVNGFLADDIDDFSKKLKCLMQNKQLRFDMGCHAQKSIEQYCPEKILKQWLELIEN